MSQLAASDRGGAADSLGQELTSANEVRRTVVRSLKIRRAGSTTVGGGEGGRVEGEYKGFGDEILNMVNTLKWKLKSSAYFLISCILNPYLPVDREIKSRNDDFKEPISDFGRASGVG